jgi:hypothetical protein
VKCDFCGAQSDDFGGWGEHHTVVEEITISRTTGHFFGMPEGGSGITYSVNMCPDCWIGKFHTWLSGLGVRFHEEEQDW